MNIALQLKKALKVLEVARLKAAEDERVAQLAQITANAAKQKQKQARKLAKLARKAARKAENRAEISLEALDRAQIRFEKIEKKAKKAERREGKENRRAAKTAAKPRLNGHAERSKARPVARSPKRKVLPSVLSIGAPSGIDPAVAQSGGDAELQHRSDLASGKFVVEGPAAQL